MRHQCLPLPLPLLSLLLLLLLCILHADASLADVQRSDPLASSRLSMPQTVLRAPRFGKSAPLSVRQVSTPILSLLYFVFALSLVVLLNTRYVSAVGQEVAVPWHNHAWLCD